VSTIFFDSDETLYAEKMAKVKAEVDVALFISESSKIDFHKVHAVFLRSKNKIMALNPTDPNRNNRVLWYQDMLRELNLAGPEPEMLGDKYWGIVLSEIKPYPDLMVVLPELSKQYSLWVLTDELLDIQRKKIDKLGLSGFFKGIISSVDAGHAKPHPELFEYAIRKAETSKDDVVMIGDNPQRDVKGANLSGIVSIFFRRGKFYYYPLEGDEKPSYILSDYTKLPEMLSLIDGHRVTLSPPSGRFESKSLG
jgi:putative hydrolase of the HAD superfamily